MLEDVDIDFVNTHKSFSDKEAARIDERYDCFVIPLANAFRSNFMEELGWLTALVKRLSIPCIVVGVGYQGKIGSKKFGRKWDEKARAFMDAVLEKSALVGIRGETTARYLESIGFEREHDFTIIGCPSMYLYGPELPRPKPLDLSARLRVNINFKEDNPAKALDYLKKVREEVAEYYFIPQNLTDIRTMFCGLPMDEQVKKPPEGDYPMDLSHPIYAGNHARAFVNVKCRLDFVAKGDLNIGTRIHGNIVGVLAGVPTFIIACDARVLELARYHHIPHVTIKKLDDGKSLPELLEGVDFWSVLEGHEQRFAHYLEFLHINGLETIFDHELSSVPFDEKVDSLDWGEPLEPLHLSSGLRRRVDAALIRWGFRMKAALEK